MKIVIISGSTRSKSQSLKVSNVLKSKVESQGSEATIVDLHELKLPVLDLSKYQQWEDTLPTLESADGIVLVVPEWNGAAAPGIMNFLTYTSLGSKPLAHKPLLVAGVSSGSGGAYPIAEVKAFGNKNNFGVHLPDQLRFSDVENIFNSEKPEEDNKSDVYIHERAEYSIKILLAYSNKLSQIRGLGIIDLKSFSNGN